ncbi:MAG: RHS repeat protein [Enterobacteriaceae bacterium]|jgi:insecticidal toxin complex protein TccC|nr:RHS repeat protein [Enterobacteriaceae bacterium]
MSTSLFTKTPSVTVFDHRGLAIRNIAYARHPDTPEITEELVTRQQYDTRGFLTQIATPRQYQTGLANFTYQNDLTGTRRRTQSADAGISITLNDAEGRSLLMVTGIGVDGEDKEDRSQAVTQTWQYEESALPGRLLSITEQLTGGSANVTERFIWAGNTEDEQKNNLAGQNVSHYDTAGLVQTNSVALSGELLSVTRRLLKDIDKMESAVNWPGNDSTVWNGLLDDEAYITQTTSDATGATLTTVDAAGNQQRILYDVAGLLKETWLQLKNGPEQVIIKSLAYSAAGQKLREEHGNGVVNTYSYEPETQRLTGTRTERPQGHPQGQKVLQDLHYEYDPVGNILRLTNNAEETRFWRNQAVVPENTYVYDSLYQLARATGREMANIGQQNSNLPPPVAFDNATYTNYSRAYSYDSAGNLTRIQHSAPASGNNYTINVTVSDRSNRAVLDQLTENASEVEAQFTAQGLQKQLLPGIQLNWTLRGELQSVVSVARNASVNGRSDDDGEIYCYGANSQRVLKVSSQKTSGDGMQSQRVTYLPGLELRTTSNGSLEIEKRQVITVGSGLAQVLHWEAGKPADITNDLLRYSYSHSNGSQGLEVDGDGNIISMEEFYPYGGTAVWIARSEIEADYKTLRYAGKERDATGLYYYGYRYYQPWAGRWLSADPAGEMGGINLFQMVMNNPVNYHDPAGLSPVKDVAFETIANDKFQYPKEGTHDNKKKETERAFAAVNARHGREEPEARKVNAYYVPEGKKDKTGHTSSEHIVPNNILIAGAPRVPKGYAHLGVSGKAPRAANRNIENAALAYEENDKAHKAHPGTGTSGVIPNPDATNDNATYLDTMRNLLHSGDISSAIQINQMGYAYSDKFRELRAARKKTNFQDWGVNVAADNSFFYSVGKIKEMYFVSNDPWDKDKKIFTEEPIVKAVTITAKDKLESAISRIAAVLQKYPTVAQLKLIVAKYNYEIPDGYEELANPITEADKTMKYYLM